MSFIYNELRKKRFFQEYVFPERINPKDIIITPESAVIDVLKPEVPIEVFIKNTKHYKVLADMICQIPKKRTDYYIFIIDCIKGIYYQNYPSNVPLLIMKYKNCNGQYDREMGFETWMLKFSSHFISKKSVILGEKEIFNNFMKSFVDCLIKDELFGVSGLLSLQYS